MPWTIRDQINQHPAATQLVEKAIRSKINTLYTKKVAKSWSDSIDLSQDMLMILPEIEELADLCIGLWPAVDLLLHAPAHSYHPTNKVNDIERARDFEGPVDALLLKLSRKLRQDNEAAMPSDHQISSFIKIQTELAARGSMNNFTRTFDFWYGWIKGPAGIQKFHDSLKSDITSTYKRVCRKTTESVKAKVNEYGRLKYNCQLEYFKKEMAQFVLRIRRLKNMITCPPRLCLDLTLYLGRHLYNMEALSEKRIELYLQRTNIAACLLDELMFSMLEVLKNEEPDALVHYLEALRQEVEFVAQYKVGGYFPESFKLLCLWRPTAASAHAMARHDEIKAKIDRAALAVEKRLELYHIEGPAPTSDWLGDKMSEYLDEIQIFQIKIPGALHLAILLLIHLGHCSYSRIPGMHPVCKPNPEDESQRSLVRKFDLQADPVLLQYLEAAKKDLSFTPLKEFETLSRDKEYLEKVGIKTHFPKSHALMKAWVG